MSSYFTIISGDVDPAMEIDVTDISGVVDLSTALSIDLLWQKPDGTDSTVPLVGIDLPNGRVKRVWVAGDTDQVGAHRGQVKVVNADGNPTTYPGSGWWIYWFVYPSL